MSQISGYFYSSVYFLLFLFFFFSSHHFPIPFVLIFKESTFLPNLIKTQKSRKFILLVYLIILLCSRFPFVTFFSIHHNLFLSSPSPCSPPSLISIMLLLCYLPSSSHSFTSALSSTFLFIVLNFFHLPFIIFSSSHIGFIVFFSSTLP